MLRNLKSLLAALALLVIPAVAHAEEPTKPYPDCGREPTDAEVQAAKGAFQAGNASFNEADYARAIDYWEDAYRRDCTANPLLLNLARAYELAGRKRQAVVSLETFLAREPNSGEKEQINRRVEVLKKKIAEEDAAAAATPPPSTGPTPPPTTGPTAPVEAPAPQAKRSPWPWIFIGVGGAATIVGTIGYIGKAQELNNLVKKCDNPNTKNVVEGRDNCFDPSAATQGNSARTAQRASGTLAVAGAALVVGGVIWWYFDGKRVEHQGSLSRPLVTPLVAPELAGLSFSGAF